MGQRSSASRLLVLATLCSLRPSVAYAEPTDQPSVARDLFDRGRELMARGDYAQACEKFAESQRLDPGGGTLLNLATCHELLGRTATAWAEFREALAMARRAQRPDRVQYAETHMSALEPKLSRLTIKVPPAVRVPGLEIRRDGVVLGPGAWGEALAVDPGEHVIVASAPDRSTATYRIDVTGEGRRHTVILDALATLPRRDAEASSPMLVPAAEPSFWTTARVLGVVGGGAGLASLGAGAFFGIEAIHDDATAARLCPSLDRCDPRSFAASEDAVANARLSTIFFVSGAVLLAAGATVFFLIPGDDAPNHTGGFRLRRDLVVEF